MSSFQNKSGNGFPSRAPISEMSMYLTFIIKDIIFEYKKCQKMSQQFLGLIFFQGDDFPILALFTNDLASFFLGLL